MHNLTRYIPFYRQIPPSALFPYHKIPLSAPFLWKSGYVVFLLYWNHYCELVSQLPNQYIIYENAYLSVTFIKALHSYAFCAISVMQSFYSRKSSNSSLSSTKIEESFASSNVVRWKKFLTMQYILQFVWNCMCL